MNILLEKFKETLYSVLPIVIIVLVLNFTITPIEGLLIFRFLLGAVLIVIGLSIFLFGADIGITPIGNLMGTSIAKTNKIWIVAIAGALLGFFISIAEPDLHILAGQVENATGGALASNAIVLVVSIGIGAMIALGFMRIVFNKPLNKILAIIYGIILVFTLFTSSEYLAISFDASGATTGAMTVPFILALGVGISSLKAGEDSDDDSFGLVAIASSGAILAVLVMSVFSSSSGLTGSAQIAEAMESTSIIGPFIQELPTIAQEVLLSLLPLLILFIGFNLVSFKLSRRKRNKILKGLLYTYIGLVLFLLGVNAAFMEVGSVVGQILASFDNQWVVVCIAFILGLVVILAEPAVYVLTEQIEDVTSGYVKRKVVMFALAIGVAVAVALSIIRIIVPGIQLWHYLLPGYIISIVLSYIVPKLFVGMAFDSGGVASGPMSATFILAFAQGVARATPGAEVLVDGFGIIAMIALTPLIAIQILGLLFQAKSRKEGGQ